MIEKLDRYIKTEENGVRISCPPEPQDIMDKINELVDAVNELREQAAEHDQEIDDCARDISKMEKIEIPAENVQKDTKSHLENVQDPVCFISTTYLSDNKTTVFLGQKGASVEFNQPLPAGFIITIKEN